uniref:Uncharacterized protein n=1 Tax=Setaria italica TaxID=4555 RepID=K3XT87_SETIT
MGSRYTACLLGRLEMEIRGARSCTLLFMLEEEGFTMKKRQRLSGGMTAAATSCITSSAAAAGSNVAGGGGGKRKDAAASTEPSADDMAMVRDGGGAPQAEAVHHQRPDARLPEVVDDRDRLHRLIGDGHGPGGRVAPGTGEPATVEGGEKQARLQLDGDGVGSFGRDAVNFDEFYSSGDVAVDAAPGGGGGC